MHRFIAGTCTMHLTITPQGPWMVRGETIEEKFIEHRGRQSLRDILCPLQDNQGNPMLPASSLKGVLRSTAERILRSMHPKRDSSLRPLADDPFVREDEAELKQLKRSQIADSELSLWNDHHKRYEREKLEPHRVYTILSPASQLFGCTLHAGLVMLDDACAKQKDTRRRSHVALDRFTGGVGEGPFIEELAPQNTPLQTHLTITNFALWHIGLLALVIQEINRGYVHMGGGTRKGQGQVNIDVSCVDIRYAKHMYTVSKGIISAQAHMKDRYRGMDDVPPDVSNAENAEQGVILLEELTAQEPQGWRDAGMVHLVVEGKQQAQQLFKEAVTKAWRMWIEEVVKEEVQEYGV